MIDCNWVLTSQYEIYSNVVNEFQCKVPGGTLFRTLVNESGTSKETVAIVFIPDSVEREK